MRTLSSKILSWVQITGLDENIQSGVLPKKDNAPPILFMGGALLGSITYPRRGKIPAPTSEMLNQRASREGASAEIPRPV